MSIIKIQHVSKRYRSVQALNDFSLEIPRGTTYGLIGPNGAGKTTLMRILAALIIPNSGQVWFENHEVSRTPTVIQRKVGYMPDFFGVYPDLTCAEYLEFYAGIHSIARHKRIGIINDLLELVDLSTKRDDLVEALSRGMKQRLCLARALVHDPEVLILDEPASGLDPRARVELRELVHTLQCIGKTIIISSHILFELAEMCTHVAILQDGQLIVAGDVETVIHQVQGKRQLEIHLLEQERLDDAIAMLKNIPTISSVTVDGKTGILADFTGDEQALHRVLADLISHGIPIVSFAPRTAGGRLEEVFMSITEGSNQQ
ncbi:MAG TPA: ABC transporter ATP-binding protein [Ktedonobacteraceae bacterium]|jgi:ABC-2 type transport system ATP-binding protein